MILLRAIKEKKMSKTKETLQSGRVKCPKCGKKGVGYAPHPHAFGYKEYSRAVCRYCRSRFKVVG